MKVFSSSSGPLVPRVWILFFLLGTLGAGGAGRIDRGQPPDQDPIVQLLPRDAIPAIRGPRFVRAERASLRPEEKVLGVVTGGEPRAYPLIELDRHEVVNDVVAKTPIAATW